MTAVATLRPYAEADANALAAIYRKGVERLGPRAYRPEQVAAWLSIAPTASDLNRLYSDGRCALIAVNPDGAPVGFGDLAGDGHIRFLYVDPDFAGRGIGRAIIAALLREASLQSIKTVFSDASELAHPLFLRAGFQCIARQERGINGIRIHNYHVCFAVPGGPRTPLQSEGRSGVQP